MTTEINRVAERRIDSKVRPMRIAGMLCAMFAGIGIADGIHQNSPASGWLVPVIAGLVIAPALAIFWHVMIGSVTGMIRTTSLVITFVVMTVLTAATLGASAQAIATSIAGQAALATELSAKVDAFNQALALAYAEATGWRGIAQMAGMKAAGLRAQANNEAGGSHGTGKGCGPKCAQYQEFAGSFENSHQQLLAMLDDAAKQRDRGDAAMNELRDAAAHGDQSGFIAAGEGVTKAITDLNAVDPRPIIQGTGGSVGSAKGITIEKETKEFNDAANVALAKRQQVAAPVFAPLSVGEATRNQIFGTALHGWILAGVIDIVPLLLLIIAFAMSREVWMNEEVVRSKITNIGRNDKDRADVDSMLGRPRTVLPFRGAAE
jgi:hypothetical protein